MEKLPYFLEKRTQNAQYLAQKLADLTDYLILPVVQCSVSPSWFGFLISVKDDAPFSKQELVEYLEKNGIGTRQLFAGNILRQPVFVENSIKLRINDSGILYSDNLTQENYKLLPNTDFIMNNTFWVGVYPALGIKEMDRTSGVIHSFIKSKV